MLKAQLLLDPKSCLNKASADEPVFVLRANDPAAPQAVRLWADMAEGGSLHSPEKIAGARNAADEMEAWQRKKYPEAVCPEPIPFGMRK